MSGHHGMSVLALDEKRLRCALTDILKADGERVANENLVIKASVAKTCLLYTSDAADE